MCQNIYSIFRCKTFHTYMGQPIVRFNYIQRCASAMKNDTVCQQREDLHLPEEDDSDVDCPDCC